MLDLRLRFQEPKRVFLGELASEFERSSEHVVVVVSVNVHARIGRNAEGVRENAPLADKIVVPTVVAEPRHVGRDAEAVGRARPLDVPIGRVAVHVVERGAEEALAVVFLLGVVVPELVGVVARAEVAHSGVRTDTVVADAHPEAVRTAVGMTGVAEAFVEPVDFHGVPVGRTCRGDHRLTALRSFVLCFIAYQVPVLSFFGVVILINPIVPRFVCRQSVVNTVVGFILGITGIGFPVYAFNAESEIIETRIAHHCR